MRILHHTQFNPCQVLSRCRHNTHICSENSAWMMLWNKENHRKAFKTNIVEFQFIILVCHVHCTPFITQKIIIRRWNEMEGVRALSWVGREKSDGKFNATLAVHRNALLVKILTFHSSLWTAAKQKLYYPIPNFSLCTINFRLFFHQSIFLELELWARLSLVQCLCAKFTIFTFTKTQCCAFCLFFPVLIYVSGIRKQQNDGPMIPYFPIEHIFYLINYLAN